MAMIRLSELAESMQKFWERNRTTRTVGIWRFVTLRKAAPYRNSLTYLLSCKTHW